MLPLPPPRRLLQQRSERQHSPEGGQGFLSRIRGKGGEVWLLEREVKLSASSAQDLQAFSSSRRMKATPDSQCEPSQTRLPRLWEVSVPSRAAPVPLAEKTFNFQRFPPSCRPWKCPELQVPLPGSEKPQAPPQPLFISLRLHG